MQAYVKCLDTRLQIIINRWPEDARFEFEERAAIIEFDSHVHRFLAEREAFEQMLASHPELGADASNSPHMPSQQDAIPCPPQSGQGAYTRAGSHSASSSPRKQATSGGAGTNPVP
jgi:hypothetical protein